MSTLSKIFVVVNFVLAMVFMVASLTLYAKKVDWVDNTRECDIRRNEALNRADTAEKAYTQLRQDTDGTLAKQKSDLENMSTALSGKEQKITTLQSANESLLADLSSIKDRIASVDQKLREFDEANQKLKTANEKMLKERDEAVLAREFAERQATEIAADLKESEAELLEIAKRNHGLMERVSAQDILLDKARSQGFSPERLVGTMRGEPVAAKVLQVDEAVGIVILNVGEKNKIKPGMQFIISRGEKYVGKVQIRNTYDEMSSAVVIPELMKEAVQINDMAQTM